MDHWYSQDCLDIPSTTHMSEAYELISTKFSHNTQNYIEALSGEKFYWWYKAMCIYIEIIILQDTWNSGSFYCTVVQVALLFWAET